ncbi:protein of unknown function [Burkholderia multivorans]
MEQGHRAIKRIVRPMPGFRRFRCDRIIFDGVELTHTIAKGRMRSDGGPHSQVAWQFYNLAK